MSAVDFAIILLTSPLIGTLLYGTYRFYSDPDGEKSTIEVSR